MKKKQFAVLVVAMTAAAFAGAATISWLTTATVAHGQESYPAAAPPSATPPLSSPYARAYSPRPSCPMNAGPQPALDASAASQVVTARGIRLVDASGRVRMSLELAPELPPGAPGAQTGPQLLVRGERGEVLCSIPGDGGNPRVHLLSE
jgi:hypothetical protein